jgi:2-polyprenyl-6-hydroxyphenyl methylase/3-demethylubiquinone-9 3-methyltransferase
MTIDDKPLGERNYEQFAARFAEAVQTKPANALYERPATLSLLPAELRGLRILDAGCGPGVYAEFLARRGALVDAVDVTPDMVALARTRLAGLGIEVRRADLARPLDWLEDGRFDVVLCPLVLDNIAEWQPVFAEFHRITRPGGCFVFSVMHPMTDWELSGAGGSYHDREFFGLAWKGYGDVKPHLQSYRRSFSAILNPLIDAGWTIDHVLEPRPSDALKAVDPNFYARTARVPYFICIRAIRR